MNLKADGKKNCEQKLTEPKFLKFLYIFILPFICLSILLSPSLSHTANNANSRLRIYHYGHQTNIQQILVYDHGRKRVVMPNRLINLTVDRCLTSVVGTMELVVTDSMIQDVKDNLSGIEIIFNGENNRRLMPLGRVVRFDRIFAPTAGRFAGMLFLGDGMYGYYPPYNSVNCGITRVVR